MEEQRQIFQAGHLLVLMIWIQNIMTDLLILRKHEEILTDFKVFGDKEKFGTKRNDYWQKPFPEIKKEFLNLFNYLSNDEKESIEVIQHLRDFFAHGRYSLKSEKIFYQPTKTRKDLREKVETLTKLPFDENQTFLQVIMNEAKYQEIFNILMKFENIIFPKIANKLGINLNRLK
jgi:hypothetical protein